MRMPMSFAAHLDLTALCKEGQLNELPHNLLTTHTPSSNSSTYLQLVHAAIAKNVLSQGKQLHSHIIQWGIAFATRTFFQNNLINMYVKCGSLVDARRVFDDMKEPDDFSWNAIIAAYRRHRLPYEALTLFLQMQRTGAQPNQFTIASVLPACAKIKALEQGMDIHHSIMGRGFLTDVVVVNALIDMYAKCGCIQKARQLFDKMPQRNVISWNSMIAGYVENGVLDEALRLFKEMSQRNVVSWNSMITGYAQNGLLDDAVRLLKEMPRPDTVSWNAIVAGYAQNGLVEKASEAFKKMQLAGLKPNSATFASILPACAKMGALEQGMDIHQSIIETGFLLDVVVASALVDMYAKCGSIHKARELFDKMSQRDVVLWNAMIAGYAQNGFVEKALEVFKQIHLAHLKPNCATFASILPACATMGALEQGMDIHQSIIESGFLPDVIVASALIDMYAKCGSIQKARQLFDKMPLRNVISWNSMIAGYAQNGFCKDALKLFELMKQSGASPNHVSFTCVLFACSHAGLVDEGYKYFNDMSDSYCITPTVDHYVCMVDLLGRAGYLEESLKLIIKMPIKPPGVVWKCLLGACRSHKNIEIGIFIASLLFELDPKNDATYVLLSNIYAEVGSWNEVQLLRKLMKDREIKKTPGCSWIEVHKMVHVFGVGDRSHPQTQEMYAKLEELSWEMKAAGYFPDSRHALNDVEQEEKETFTCHHSEKLAIAFGLLNTPPRTTIRVVKNLRVCVDCHSATKFISNIAARQIVVRDANRFHHFKQGECSCGDYW